ncbi:fibrillin-2-like [Pungitius pungitius]|uniref:fibrillin-2-like n=1 Tax=Pungitius pungitius TaxID=134920 RepID=UPI002E15B019
MDQVEFSITKEQCCSAAARDGLCDKGIKMAVWQGACETPFFQGKPWEIQISKMCCDCCALGLITASQGSSCNFQGLLLLETCLQTAKACCDKSSTAANKPTENEVELRVTQRCCEDGRDRALLGQYCTTLSFFSPSYTCSITKGQCCSAAVGEWFCNNGIKMAKEKGTCQRLFSKAEHWETQMSKMCCDCCLLGLMTASQNSICDFEGLLLGRQCLDTAKACCEKYTAVIKPTTNAPVTESLNFILFEDNVDLCRDLNCSQLCKGNGTCACLAGYELQSDGVNCQEIELSTVQRCCRDGRDLALAGQHCTATLPISSSNTCNITKEQCCSAAARDGLCDKGIKMAEWQGACETPFFQGKPWEIQISKTCCDCCILGLMTASQSSSCNFQGLLLLETCLYTARACCEKSSTAENIPTENEVELRVTQRCCKDGRDRALLGQHCTTLSFFSSSFTCSITKEQCCSAAVGEWFCKNGTELAKEKGTCHGLLPKGEPWETQIAKMCCDCCLLGLMTASQNSSCDFQGLLPGRQCLDTAKACCEKYTAVIKPTTNEIELSPVQRCCRDGRDLALAGQHCTATPPISSSNTCNITKEQCCSAAARDGLCDKGIKMAEWQGACETPFFQGKPWEIQISKTCCDCCMLGLMTASRSSSCNFQGLLLLETCLFTARACCEKRSKEENKPTENEVELRAVQSCCQDGRDRAYIGQRCSTLSSFSSSYSCSITREQCCSAAVGEWFCKNGTELAKEKGTCHGLLPKGEPWETQIAKMCCDCCLLGLMTASQNSSCDFQGLLPGRQCLDTAKACCEKYTAVIKPTTNAPVTGSLNFTLSPDKVDSCRDLNCSQLCKGNGTCACLAGYELQSDGVNCQEIELSPVQRCCRDGRDLALTGQHCTATPPISSSNTCNITKEQCCSAAARDGLCDKGIKMAEWQGACETPFFQGKPWEIQISKTCCDCCMLGLMTASRSSSCNFQGLLLLETCLFTARACCEKRSKEENKPTENEVELRAVQSCCQDGRDQAYSGQHCTPLYSIFSSSYSCSITKEQCCSAVVGEWFCNNGIELAKKKGTCHGLSSKPEHWEFQKSKMCCDCCLLGLMTASQNSSCDFQGLLPGRQCLDTAKACCGRNTTEIKPTSNEIELSTVQRCCQDGRDLALAGQHCTATLPISSSNTCNITKEQCCSAAARDGLCDKGIKMAEWQGACETPFFQGKPWEIQISKTCCDCCMLGLMTASRSSSCNFQGLLLLETCLFTARACCEKRSKEENKPTQNEIELRAVQSCCQDGRDRAYSGQHCTTLSSFFSSSDSCSITREQCCSAVVGEWFCKNGIELAKGKGTCQGLSSKPEHWEFQISKMCCDCCLLGLMTASQNSNCDFQGLLPGRQCLDTAKACCEKYTAVIKPTTNAPVTGSLNFTLSRDKVDSCKDLNCSQLCKGNGACACLAGYELQSDGVNCQDVDECRTGNVCGNHGCVNLVGTYRCECRIGFMFNSLTRQCEDIDECAWPAGGHQCSYSCSNVPGSFRCTCPSTGYMLAQNGRTCQDIDECAAGTHTCSLPGSCFNILGGFRCLSLACPQYFQLAGQGKFSSASWNCFKVSHPQDVGCYYYSINFISYISVSLPTVRVMSEPKEITFLQTTAVANYAHLPGGTDVFFNILVSDDQSSFDVIKRSYEGMFVGVVRQVKPLRGPKNVVFQVSLTYVKSGVVSYRNIVIIHFFISEFCF